MAKKGSKAHEIAIEHELGKLIYSRWDVFYTGKKAHAAVLARAFAEDRLSIWNRWRARNKDMAPKLQRRRGAKKPRSIKTAKP